jgi:hypothetical protein
MERMVADYGSCKGAKDIARVLRVPGFLHRKGIPHLVRIISAPGHRYSREEILAAFPPIPRKPPQPAPSWQPQRDDDERIADALRSISADDRQTWLEVGMALKSHLGEAGKGLWDRWSRTSGKYDERDSNRVWSSFKKSGFTIATLFHHAAVAGWRSTISESERMVWKAAGNFLWRLRSLEDAHDTFWAWFERNPIIPHSRAEWIFQFISNKDFGQ